MKSDLHEQSMPIYSKCSGLTSKSNKFTVAAGETTTKTFTDKPQSDPVGVLLGKVDKTTNANKPKGSASIVILNATIAN